MTSFDLELLNAHLLGEVVKKLNLHSGTTFYRTCDGAQSFMDQFHPRLRAPEAQIVYNPMYKSLSQKVVRPNGSVVSSTVVYKDYSFAQIDVVSMIQDQLMPFGGASQNSEEDILEDLAKMKGVAVMRIHKIEESFLAKCLSVLQPRLVSFHDKYYAIDSPVFENVPRLEMSIHPLKYQEVLDNPKRILEVGRRKKEIILDFYCVGVELAERVIKRWLDGENIGSLKRLTIKNTTDDSATTKEFFDKTAILGRLTDPSNKTGQCLAARIDRSGGGPMRLEYELLPPNILQKETISFFFQ